MQDRKDFIEMFLDTNHLMYLYTMDWYRKNFAGLEPRQGQGRILSALKQRQQISQKELGLILDIRPQSLGEHLQKLEAHGYVKRYRSPTDKRAFIVEITEKGKTFQLSKPNYEEIFSVITDEEITELKLLLEKISARLKMQLGIRN